MANLHTVGGSRPQRDNLPFHSLEAKSPKSRCPPGWLLLEGARCRGAPEGLSSWGWGLGGHSTPYPPLP